MTVIKDGSFHNLVENLKTMPFQFIEKKKKNTLPTSIKTAAGISQVFYAWNYITIHEIMLMANTNVREYEGFQNLSTLQSTKHQTFPSMNL